MPQNMTTTITALTPEQTAAMGPWADKWIAKGLCTETANWAQFERAARECYAHAGLDAPPIIVQCSSPRVAARLAAALEKAVIGGLKAFAKDPGETVWDDVSKAFRYITGLHLEVTKEYVADTFSVACSARLGGQFWLSWQARESFVHEYLQIKTGKEAEAKSYREAQEAVNFWYPYKWGICVSDRPREIHLEQVAPRGWGSHRLHCETGAAIKWADGFGVYAWHGVQIPWEKRHALDAPETLTKEEIQDEVNHELRRALIEIYGPGRYLADTGAKLLAYGVENDMPGAAPRALLEDSSGQRWLLCTDGSTGKVFSLPLGPEITTLDLGEIHEALSGLPEGACIGKS